MSTTPDYQTLIVGAGFSGIGAAIQLDRAGLTDYLLVEAGDGVGGTWHWNTYPGIAVDIPSFSYQFSFEQSRHWSRTYAPGRELQGLRRTLRRQIRHPIANPVQHQGHFYRIRRRTRALAGADGPGRGGHRQVRHQRQRRADRAEPARHRRGGLLRRHHHAHRAVGPRPGPDRQARRHHRHRRLGRPSHPRDRTNCGAAHSISAHTDLVLPQVRRPAARRGSLGDADSRRKSSCSGCSARRSSR